ncbi:MAG: sulfatase [Planctomycetota bacterium]
MDDGGTRIYLRLPDDRDPNTVRIEAAKRYSLADVCAGAGYRTAAFGKLHLTPYCAGDPHGRESYAAWEAGGSPDEEPYYGFQRYEPIVGHGPGNHWHHGGAYGRHLHSRLPDLGQDLGERLAAGRIVPGIPDLSANPIPDAHSDAAWLADRVCTYLAQRDADRPFCCFVGFPGPHHPFTPSADVLAEFQDAPVADPATRPEHGDQRPLMAAFAAGEQLQRLPEPWLENARHVRRYTDALVHQIDRAVGRILDALQKAGIEQDTLVVFTSDHGDFLGDFGCYRKTCLNARQLLHVPLILRLPGVDTVHLAEQCRRPTSNTDILPTLAAAAGIPLPCAVHGLDLLAPQPANRAVFAYAHQAMNSVRDDRRLDNGAVFRGRHHYLHAPQAGLEELFDVSVDPHETRDLASTAQGRPLARELRDTLAHGLLGHHQPGLGKIACY